MVSATQTMSVSSYISHDQCPPLCCHEDKNEKLEQLYETYYTSIWYAALGYLKDPQLAEDIVQETFIKVSEHLSCIQEINSKMTKYFLITIAKNKSIDYIRKRSRMQETLIETQEYLPDYEDYPLEHIIHEETFQELNTAINRLEKPYRIPLQLRYIHGLSNMEIAKSTGLSVNLVAVRINRAKKMLKQLL